jgi:hypothetical protein
MISIRLYTSMLRRIGPRVLARETDVRFDASIGGGTSVRRRAP